MKILRNSFDQFLGRSKIEGLIKKIAFIYWCIGGISVAITAICTVPITLLGLVAGDLAILFMGIFGVLSIVLTIIMTLLVCLGLCATSEVIKLLTEIRNSVANTESGSKVVDSNDLPTLL